MIFKNIWLLSCLLISIFIILLSIVLAFNGGKSPNIWEALAILFLAQIGGTILFPILVGYFYDKIKRDHDVETIWTVFKDLSDGGILRVYKDREENVYEQNALLDLRNAFENVRDGEIRLVGVSLRVFFNEPGPFFRSIYKLCEYDKNNKNGSSPNLLVAFN